MAAKKKTPKTNGRGRKPRIDDIPAGFVEVEAARTAGFWKPKKKGDKIIGIVGELQKRPNPDGTVNVFYQIILTTDTTSPVYEKIDGKEKLIEVGRGQTVGVSGWKSALQFLKPREGKDVGMIFEGLGKAKPGMHAPMQFRFFERRSAEE